MFVGGEGGTRVSPPVGGDSGGDDGGEDWGDRPDDSRGIGGTTRTNLPGRAPAGSLTLMGVLLPSMTT